VIARVSLPKHKGPPRRGGVTQEYTSVAMTGGRCETDAPPLKKADLVKIAMGITAINRGQ